MTTIETKEKQVINITNIVFDDKLKEFIMKTKERVDLSGLSLMSSKTIDDVLELLDPNIVKVVVDKNNFALYFSRAPIPYLAPNAEIDQVTYYKHIGLYGYTKDFLFTYKNLPISNLPRK